MESGTADPAGQPERLTRWSEFFPYGLTVSADGKRLSYLKVYGWDDMYLGEFGQGGTSMKPPRRFTFDRRGSFPNTWTLDSQAILFTSDRSGKSEVFRQGLSQRAAEPLLQGPADYKSAAVTPDGSWLLYMEVARTNPGASPAPLRLMRRPLAGGSPEVILEEPAGAVADYLCPVKPDAACVLVEYPGREQVFSRLDIISGRGERLGAIKNGVANTLSPDGEHVAVLTRAGYERTIKLLTISDHSWREISIEPGWDVSDLAWTADGKGFLVTAVQGLLYVTPAGKVKPLLLTSYLQGMRNPLPSPDGKFLAYEATGTDSNVWLLDNF